MSSDFIDPSQLKEIRVALAGHLREAQQLLQQNLNEIDLDKPLFDFPEEPSDEDLLTDMFRIYSLVMRKEGFHVAAVLRANEQGNLHSLGVQTNVLIECAAEITSISRTVVEKTPEALDYLANNLEYDHNYWLLRITRGGISKEDLKASTTKAREGVGRFDGKLPRKVNLSERVSILTQGRLYWDHLNDSFCHTTPDRLRMTPGLGGVMPAPELQFDLAFADIMDCTLHYVCWSLVSYGALKINRGTSQLFDNALALSQRARETAAPFRALQKQIVEGDATDEREAT